MIILGVSAFYHDAAACLVINGEIVAAAQEERFTRIKHDSAFPARAIEYCLNYAEIQPELIDKITFYDKPFLKFERLLETYIAFAPKGFKSFSTSMPVWLHDKIFQKLLIIREFSKLFGEEIAWGEKLLFSEHHLSHAASAFFPSPFDEAAVLTMDGVGEWTTSSIAIGRGNTLSVLKEIHFPHSLGLLYSAITQYIGFKVNSGEYKVMGLAPYGTPKYANLIKDNLIDIKEDGSFHLDMCYFDYCTGLKMINERFNHLFGAPPRLAESKLTQRDMDIASSVQAVAEEVIFKISKDIRKTTGQKNLCLAGGVALNCVINGNLLRENIFENIWIQPAAGDAGGSIGAALASYYLHFKHPRVAIAPDAMKGSFLGPKYEQEDINRRLTKMGAIFTTVSEAEMISLTAQALVNGQAVGWHQGRMEFGPRSLGGRSILADPRSTSAQKQLNLKVKYRESFRPFAPSVLREKVSDWFDLDSDSPYMLLVANVAYSKQLKMSPEELKLFGIEKLNVPRSEIPAVTHVDYSARIQTVHKDTNPLYFKLITKFNELTGVPVLVNTSFNVRGEPIVCTPEDSFNCMMGTEIEFLVIGNAILKKEDQNPALLKDYKIKYELD
jgi:carbamoyltransferase